LAVDACIHDGFVAFTLLDESRVRPLFLLYALHLSRSVHRKNTAGAIFQNLTTTDINRLDLVVPSIASQDTFIERLAAVRNMTEKLSMTVSALDSLLASLQQRAFSGTL
jgi:type I restriction enzyme S subunit